MLIPNQLTGTATESLLKQIEAAATQRNLFVRRDWKHSRYGGAAVYSVLRGTAEVLPSIMLDGGEGKTPRSATYKQLARLLTDIEALPIPTAEELPTIPVPGLWILRDQDRTRLHELGARWFADEPGCMLAGNEHLKAAYRAPEKTVEEVRALLESRRAISLGVLSWDHRTLVEQLIHERDRLTTKDRETRILAQHEAVVREAFAGEQWVSVGSRFPHSANEALRGLGARWSDGKWIVRKRHEAAAQAIIEGARAQEKAEQEAQRAKAEQEKAERKAAGIIEWSEGEGYGGRMHRVGELVYRAPERGAEKGWYVVIEADKEFFREDGMSFGVGDDRGYVFSAMARPATEEEIAAHLAQNRAEWLQSLRRDTEERGRYLSRLVSGKTALWQGYTHFQSDGDWPEKPADGWFLGGMKGSNYWMRIGENSLLIHVENTYDTVMSWYYEVPLVEVDAEALAILKERK